MRSNIIARCWPPISGRRQTVERLLLSQIASSGGNIESSITRNMAKDIEARLTTVISVRDSGGQVLRDSTAISIPTAIYR